MQAQLNLAFVHRVAVLLHITRLDLTGLAELIAERRIESIAIVYIDLSSAANITLAVDKKLVVEGQVERARAEIRAIQGQVGECGIGF